MPTVERVVVFHALSDRHRPNTRRPATRQLRAVSGGTPPTRRPTAPALTANRGERPDLAFVTRNPERLHERLRQHAHAAFANGWPAGTRFFSNGDRVPVVAGYVTLWDTPADRVSHRLIIRRGTFRDVLRHGAETVALVGHDPSLAVARTSNRSLRLKEDEFGLVAVMRPAPTEHALGLVAALRMGHLTKMSLQLNADRDSWQTLAGVMYREVFHASALDEISFVVDPAIAETTAVLIGEYTPKAPREFGPEAAGYWAARKALLRRIRAA